jgi:hypothetical protein
MKTTVKCVFTLKVGDSYSVLDKNKNEIGTFEVNNDFVNVIIGDEETQLKEPQIQDWFEENEYLLSKESPRWVEYNPNPAHNSKANDCTIRAYCAAENLSWDAAYDIACQHGKNIAYMPNDNTTVTNIAEEEFGYTKQKLTKEERGMTVNEFAIKYNKGTYLVLVASHLVAVIDGEYYDTWDCGKKKVRHYFSKS